MTADNQTNKLGQQSIGKLLLTMSFPGILGNMSNILYNVVDRIFVGNYQGRNALGAIAAITPLTNIVTAVSLFLTVGGASYLAITLGKNDAEHADKIFTNIAIQALVSSFMVSAVYFLFAPFLVVLCGAKTDTALYELALPYLRIICIGQIFQVMQLALASAIRAEGHIKYSMTVSLIGSITNVILDAVFVAGLSMGIKGAAAATVISQLTALCMACRYYLLKKGRVRFRGLSCASIKENIIIIKLGMAPAIYQGLMFVSNILLNKSLRKYGDRYLEAGGDVAISAMGVITTIDMIIILIVMGINQAVSPIISYNYGAGNYGRVKKASLYSQLMALLIGLLVWAVMMGYPEVLFALFSGGDKELMEYGSRVIRTMKMFSFFMGVQTLSSMFYSAIGKPKIATAMSFARQLAFFVPLLLILPHFWGLEGIFYAQAVSDLCVTIVVLAIYARYLKRIDRI